MIEWMWGLIEVTVNLFIDGPLLTPSSARKDAVHSSFSQVQLFLMLGESDPHFGSCFSHQVIKRQLWLSLPLLSTSPDVLISYNVPLVSLCTHLAHPHRA